MRPPVMPISMGPSRPCPGSRTCPPLITTSYGMNGDPPQVQALAAALHEVLAYGSASTPRLPISRLLPTIVVPVLPAQGVEQPYACPPWSERSDAGDLPAAVFVDQIRERFAAEEPADVFGEDGPGEVRREGRARRSVRGDDEVRGGPQRVSDRQRLGGGDVEASAGQVALFQRVDQGRFVHDLAA